MTTQELMPLLTNLSPLIMVAIAWGSTQQRIKALEKRAECLELTGERLSSLEAKIDFLTKKLTFNNLN